MKKKLVRDVMAIGVPTCETDAPLTDVAHLLSEEARDILVVMGDGGVEGVVSQSDMARAFLTDYRSMAAKDIMSAGMYSVSPDVPLETAIKIMLDKDVHQLLVMPDDGENAVPAGVLSKRHLLEIMAE